MNIWDLAILAAVFAAVALAAHSMRKQKKTHGRPCCGDCASCAGCEEKHQGR